MGGVDRTNQSLDLLDAEMKELTGRLGGAPARSTSSTSTARA